MQQIFACKTGEGYPQGDGLVDSAIPIFGFLHIATLGRWREVVDEIFNSLRYSGLYERTATLFIGVVGPEADTFMPPDERTKVIHRSTDLTDYEFPTLSRLHQFCQKRGAEEAAGGFVYYLHTKGVSQDTPATEDWRAYMLHFLADRHEDCMVALSRHDICGVNWLSLPWPHFSGNFWWARVDYVRRLRSVEEIDATPTVPIHGRRHACERWIGTGEGVRSACLHQSNIDHYRQRFSPTRYVARRRPVSRIAIVFDNTIRPDTTGVYCLRASHSIAGVSVVHLRPSQLDAVTPDDFDLYLYIDDGLDYSFPGRLRPSAYWAIDTHLNLERSIRRAHSIDFVFAAQRNGVELLCQAGVHCVGWLPLACDPVIHRLHEVEKSFDVCFVGHLNTQPRQRLAKLIADRYARSFVGQRFFDEMGETYARSRIVLNLSVCDDINMRMFEALACGSMLLTNDVTANGLDRLFTPGEHLAVYRDFEELIDRIDHYLSDTAAREQIAAAGRMAALANHTYEHRMRTLLDVVAAQMIVPTATVPESSTEKVAKPASSDSAIKPSVEAGLTSIVILTFNGLSHTRACLESIERFTPEPHEIIVIDNGSTDGTLEFLRKWVESASVSADCPQAGSTRRLIENGRNLGFPVAANQGILASRGQFVLLLNNDVIVTAGWLGRMLSAMSSSDDIGLVGPCSNRVSGVQQVPVSYVDTPGLLAHAADWAARFRGEGLEVDRLVGFCLLIKRELINQIGLLDERFGIGNFEDDDYCRRARSAGFRAVVALDSFVHHHGSATFEAMGFDHRGLLEQNLRLFNEKWRGDGEGPPPRRNTGFQPVRDGLDFQFQISDLRSCTLESLGRSENFVESNLPHGLETRVTTNTLPVRARNRPKLSLCMIVRDSARTLPACLASVCQWVDEMIVVDTGSTDDTAAIAAQFGAKVSHFPWCDSFAAARNVSFERASGEWLIWMDADDTIDEANGRKLRALVEKETSANLLGYVMQVHCPAVAVDDRDESYATATAVDHVKLVRNLPGVRFSGRIHEQLLPAIRKLGGDVAWTDLFVVHSGSDLSAAGRERKHARDLRLLELELADAPDSTFALFNLGMTLLDAGRPAEALAPLCQSLQLAEPGESHIRKLHAFLAQCYVGLGRPTTALRVCQRALETFPDDPELLFRQGVLEQQLGRLVEAERSFRSLLAGQNGRVFSSVDQGIVGVKAWHNLAVVYESQRRPDKAADAWRRVLEYGLSNRLAWRGLIDALSADGQRVSRSDRAAALERIADAEPDVPTELRGLAMARAASLQRAMAGAL